MWSKRGGSPLSRQVITTLNRAFRWLIVFIVTLIVCIAGSAPVFTTSLFVPEFISYPLTLLVMGVLAALTSSWMSNLFSGDSTHSRILRIVALTEIAAILLVLSRGLFVFGLNIVLLAIWGIIISVSAYVAAWHFRSSAYSRRGDTVVSLVLLALASTVVVVTIAIASRLGLTGA